MRALVCGMIALVPGMASAEAFSDYGRPDQCGAYAEAQLAPSSWFPGGEGGTITLTAPTTVRGLNALLYDGVISEEGFSDPAGRVLAVRAPLLSVEGQVLPDVLVVVTERGIRLLQPCP